MLFRSGRERQRGGVRVVQPDGAARLVHERRMGPLIIVFPDCFTALGGNQYVNSSAIGAYADYLTKEIVPFVDLHFRTLASREHRGCFGKSSGGYGSIVHGMQYAQHWGAVACHSGDAYFDFVYWHDWPNTLNELARHRQPRNKAGAYDALAEASRKGLAEGAQKVVKVSVWLGALSHMSAAHFGEHFAGNLQLVQLHAWDVHDDDHRAARVRGSVAARFEGHGTASVITALAGDDVDDAAHGVGAVQRRSAVEQDLHPLDGPRRAAVEVYAGRIAQAGVVVGSIEGNIAMRNWLRPSLRYGSMSTMPLRRKMAASSEASTDASKSIVTTTLLLPATLADT